VVRCRKTLLTALTWLAFLCCAAAAAASSNNVTYNGGPVAHSMTGVVVDWGASINSMYTNETTGDPGFVKYLAAESGSPGDIGGVLAQYMDSSGHNAANRVSYGQQFQITPSVTATTIYDSQIQAELINQIDAGHLPHPAGNGLGTIYLVLFPNGDVECIDSQTCSANAPNSATADFCAYHASTQLPDGTEVLYAVLPDNTSGPMSTECGSAPTLMNDHTATLSHEWSETITDPLGNAWWVNNSSSPDYGNEIGDSCNQVMASEGGWTVQQQWSNRDGNCMASEPAYAAPTASFVAPSVAATAQQVSFDASSSTDPAADSTAISGTSYAISSGISSYRWTWGDGSSSSSATATATHTYAAVGNYNVSLTVTDNLGFSSTVTQPLAITSDGTAPPYATTGGSSGVSDKGATLQGTVNPENQSAQYQFVYGTSPTALSQSTPLTSAPTGQNATAVSATLSGLTPSTTYYYRLDMVASGQTYSGLVQSFTTTATPPPPQTPSAATGSASGIGTASAIITGTIDPGGTQKVSYHFAYGTSPNSLTSGTLETGQLSGTTSISVSAELSGLTRNTTYYFQLDATLNGETYSGAVHSFTTRLPAPGTSTGAATAITSSGATVSGTVSPNGAATSYLVEFGTTTAYGHSTASFAAGGGGGTVPVKVTLSGLAPRTRYHYRLVATSAGGTAVGGDRTFTTAPPLARAPRFSFVLPSRTLLRAALNGKLRVRFRCSRGCSARFTATLASAQISRFTPVTVTLGRAAGSSRSDGRGIAVLRLSSSVRARLRGHHALKLMVFGYAVSRGSARTPPRARPLVVSR
jgi:PKD repeat protein